MEYSDRVRVFLTAHGMEPERFPLHDATASFIGEMNFIDKGDKTIAVRPEDVTISLDGSGDFTGTVRTIMVLGHYVVVNVQHGENVIKCFVDRDISEKLSVGQSVGMHIGKHTVFDK